MRVLLGAACLFAACSSQPAATHPPATDAPSDAGAPDAPAAADAVATTASGYPTTPSHCTARPSDLVLATELGFSIEGFGCNAVGGLGGTRCTVSVTSDDPKSPAPGSLRACMEKHPTPVTVTFAPALAGQEIRLAAPIAVRSDTTLDGRMPQGAAPVVITNALVALSNVCHPSSPKYKPDANLCSNPGLMPDANGNQSAYYWNANQGGYLFDIGAQGEPPATNVILTDLTLRATLPAKLPASLSDTVGTSTFPNPCALANDAPADGAVIPPTDVLGCPVLVNIGSVDPAAPPTRDLVIAHSDLSRCGDKCIVGNTATDAVTIVGNHFHDAYYAALLLMSQSYDLSPSTAPSAHYTLYANHFERVLRRSPRCASFVWCHLFDNVIADWGTNEQTGFGISANGAAQIYAENDFFSPPASYAYQDTTPDGGAPRGRGNPAIDIEGDDANANGTLRGPGLVYDASYVIVAQDKVQPPNTGVLLSGPYPLEPDGSRVFSPAKSYAYTPRGPSQAAYDAIIAAAGPRARVP